MDTECSQPIPIRQGGGARLARCRMCPQCLRAAQRYWAAAAANQIRTAHSMECRSWVGTCTFTPEIQDELLARARMACSAERVEWDGLSSSEKFLRLQQQALDQAQKYWKRLRGRGLTFKYFCAFEEDQSGRPHMHCLVHETDAARPIRKRELDESWGLGFTSFKLLRIGPNDSLPYEAISYVTKSLAKHRGSRQCASTDYRPERRVPKSERPQQLKLGLG